MAASDAGTGPKIMELDLTETFHKDEEETYLTAEDTLTANAEAEKEKKLREEGKYDEYRMSYYSSYLPSRGLALDLFPELGVADTTDALLRYRFVVIVLIIGR
jgi:hypothetical protein